MLKVKNWNKWFEGAKTRTYKRKSTCLMPCKHGLGYRRIIRLPNGPALFGAWVALVQVLSRHDAPREGYLTDTGRPDGKEYTPQDLEMLTDIPANIFEDMIRACSEDSVGWLVSAQGYRGDTAGIADGHHADTARIPKQLSSVTVPPLCPSDTSPPAGEQAEKPKPKPKKAKKKKFVKPTLEEVEAYCKERKSHINPQTFYSFYESKGWRVGNQSMTDWQAAVRHWETRPERRPVAKGNQPYRSDRDYDSLFNQGSHR